MANATYLNGARRASWSSRPCNAAGAPSHIFIPNASTPGPPTSRAVQVNQGSFGADHRRSPPTELETRLHLALATVQPSSSLVVKPGLCQSRNLFRDATLGFGKTASSAERLKQPLNDSLDAAFNSGVNGSESAQAKYPCFFRILSENCLKIICGADFQHGAKCECIRLNFLV